MSSLSESSPADAVKPDSLVGLLPRSIAGGVLMGLANLVPGISGGTMLVAAGIYTRFINAIAEVTTFKFRPASVLTLAFVAMSAVLAIGLGAGAIKALVVDHRWIMYAIFIGLTLGGVPVVWKMIGQSEPGTLMGALFGFVLMAALAWVQMLGMGQNQTGNHTNFLWMILAGIAGASAMILPGVSGGYLLLVLGVYIPILTAIETTKESLTTQQFDMISAPVMNVIVPVAIGVLIGVVVVSNVLRFCLKRFEKTTLGVLIGLLLGAVVGLYPFQVGVAPKAGAIFRSDTVVIIDNQPAMQSTGKIITPDEFPIEFFTPNALQIAGAIGLIVVGFLITLLIAKIGSEKTNTIESASEATSS